MTGVRTMSGMWTCGIVLAAAALWLTRVNVVLPSSVPIAPHALVSASPEAGWSLGMRLEDAAGGPGVMVSDVEPGTPAAQAGVQPGDLLLFVDDQLASSARQARDMLQGVRPSGCMMLELVRNGSALVLNVPLPDNPKSGHTSS